MKTRILLGLTLTSIAPIVSAQVALNQIDTFTDLSNAFWGGGANPTVISTGGPAGTNDAFLQFTGTGSFGSGGVPAITNTLQWTGNYQTAGVKFIQMNLKNFSATPLIMRIMFHDDAGARWTTTNANSFTLPGNSGWLTARFRLDAAGTGWTSVAGASTWAYVSTHVTNCLIRHNAPNPTSSGTFAAATVGVDNITAIDGVTVTPLAYQVTAGLEVGGSLASLQSSDNNSLIVAFDSSQSVGRVLIDGLTDYLNPASIDCTIESASSRRDMSQFFEAFNYSTGLYTNVIFRVLTIPDSTATGTISTNVTQYISAVGMMQMRVRWLPNADMIAQDGWLQRIDMVRWKLKP